MPELQQLNDIDFKKLPKLEKKEMETLYEGIFKNLHIELGYSNVLYLFSPHYAILYPETLPSEVLKFIKEKSKLLEFLKVFFVENLIKYSFLAEGHSYYIEQNDYTVIARIRERNFETLQYEIKYYTNSPEDIIDYYEDKIYIGRDFIKLDSLKRKKFGLKEHINSILYEIDRLIEVSANKIHDNTKDFDSYLNGIKILGDEFYKNGKEFLKIVPQNFRLSNNNDFGLLKNISHNTRNMKHRLLEIKEDLNEFATLLRENEELDFVRYVIKFKTDIVNLINYFNYKIICNIIQCS